MTGNDFRLITLGRVALLHPDGTEDELGKRRRKLALLALLAVRRTSHTRDSLIEMFWGGQEETKARHSLSDVLSNIRRVIRPDCIQTTQMRVALAPDAPLTVDANDLEEAASQKKWSRVVDLYQGDFLEGVTVPGSITFDTWVTAERARLRQLFLRACERRIAILGEDGEWPQCVELAQRWVNADPLSADAALALLQSYREIGTTESLRGAQAEYCTLNDRLLREFDSECDDKVSALAAMIAREEQALRSTVTDRATPDTISAGITAPRVAYDNSVVPVRRKSRRKFAGVAAGSIVVLALGTVAAIRLTREHANQDTQSAIAIVDLQNLQGDSADAWLEDGLPQLIASNLGNVIPPERVKQVRERNLTANERNPTLAQLLSIGRDLRANTVVSGGYTHGPGNYVLNLTVHDAATGKVVRLFTVSDSNVFRLADAAAARLVAVPQNGRRTQIADVETPSVQAYQHFIRFSQEWDVGHAVSARHELDAAIALDSALVPAVTSRLQQAQEERDTAVVRRLRDQIVRHPERGSDYDRLVFDIVRAQTLGDRSRELALSRLLAARYPHDPRALVRLSETLFNRGDFTAEDSVLRALVALDSLGMESGSGPCAMCSGYGGLVNLQFFLGKPEAAEPMLKRWISLQPDAAVPYGMLGDVYRFEGRFDEAFTFMQRAYDLSGDEGMRTRKAHALLEARRFEAVDSAIADWRRNGPPPDASEVEMQLALDRERGQYARDAGRPLSYYKKEGQGYVIANSVARAGRYRDALNLYKSFAHEVHIDSKAEPWAAANDARFASWSLALGADAYAPSGDTVELRALSDSIQRISQRSFYGRDMRLHHHVNGLILMQRGAWREAIDEFEKARWGGQGWTTTIADIARCYIALNRPLDAVRILRDGYRGPIDAMARYEPRSNLDYLMSLSFQQAGMRDSAAVYASHVRRAWQNADPPIKAQLAKLKY